VGPNGNAAAAWPPAAGPGWAWATCPGGAVLPNKHTETPAFRRHQNPGGISGTVPHPRAALEDLLKRLYIRKSRYRPSD
jgi:hypothetical protein